MIDQRTRAAILALHKTGKGIRAIRNLLGVSRAKIREVIEAGTDLVPRIERAEKADAWRDQILAEYARCEGSLVRVHEELSKLGARLPYSTLTAWCRRHGIGTEEPKPPAGRYEFAPGEEAQHDTCEDYAEIGGVEKRIPGRVLGPLLLADDLFSGLPALPPLRVQALPDRSGPVFPGCLWPLHDRQHPRRRAARLGQGHGAGARDGRVRRAPRRLRVGCARN